MLRSCQLSSSQFIHLIPTKIQPKVWMNKKNIPQNTRIKGSRVHTLSQYDNLWSKKFNYIHSPKTDIETKRKHKNRPNCMEVGTLVKQASPNEGERKHHFVNGANWLANKKDGKKTKSYISSVKIKPDSVLVLNNVHIWKRKTLDFQKKINKSRKRTWDSIAWQYKTATYKIMIEPAQ